MLLSDALMKYETLTKEQIDSLVETGEYIPVEKLEKEDLTLEELKAKAKELKIKGYSKMNKEDLKKALKEESGE